MKSEKPKNKRSRQKLLKRIGLILSALLLVPLLLFTIGWFNRDMIIDELQDWYRNNSSGTLEIGEVNATFISGFPNVGFTIKDIYHTNFDTILDKSSSIFIKETQVTIAAGDLLTGDLKFRNISIDNAKIKTEVNTQKTVARYINLKRERQANPSTGVTLPRWLSKKTNFSLHNVSFVAKDSMLHKYFNLQIQDLRGSIIEQGEKISGNLDLNITVNDLGFNTSKGSFINGAVVKGNPEFVLDQNKNILKIPEFPLKIDDQDFETTASFDFNGTNSYSFALQNPETDFQQIKKLLPDSISVKLAPYKITEPIATKLSLDGEFRYGDVPLINGSFATSNNMMNVGDNLNLQDVSFAGELTNILSNEENPEQQEPSKPDIKILFEDFNASLEDIKISAINSYYQSSKEALNFVNINLKMDGSNGTLNKVLQNQNFSFKGGNFDLDTKITGDIPNNREIFNAATGRFTINNTRVVLNENNLQLPIQILDLRLDQKNSMLEKLKINLGNNKSLVFSGNIKNINALIADDPVNPASADVSIESDSLNINDLIATAVEFIPDTEKSPNNLKTLHQTFEAIYHKFQPRFRLDIKTVEYNGNSFEDLMADIQLTDAETVRFSNLSFNYQNAITELDGTLKIPKPDNNFEEPVFLNAEARSSGPLKVFQDLFKIKLVDIRSGEFGFTGNVTGNIQKFEQLLENANGDLELLNAQFYYPKAALNIAFDSLQVSVHNSNIKLDRFEIEIGDHHPFALRGRIEDFPGFLLDSIKSTGKAFIGFDAAFLNMEDWMHTVHSMDLEVKDKQTKNRDLAAIFADIYRFDPEIEIAVDSLKYKDLIAGDIAALVYFENDSILKLDDLKIRFKNSKALIRGQLAAHNIKETEKNPFNFQFSVEASGRSQDLNDLLQTVNFDLRSGNFKFSGSYNGEARDLKILNSNAQGDLILGATNVDIKGTDIKVPVDSLHLYIQNNLATLERLDVELPGKSSIDITGKIDNFSSFINNDQAMDSHNSSFKIRSPYLDSKDIKKFIGSTGKKKDSSERKPFEMMNFKDILTNINNSYFPSANITIDSLIHRNIAVSGFTSEIGFNDSGDIKIGNTNLKYHEGSANLMIQGGLGTSKNLPVKIKMNIEDIEIEDLVKDLNYFKNDELRKAEKIGGSLDLEFDVNGVFDEVGKLKMNSLNGSVKVDLEDLELYNFEPLLESVVLLKEERFEKLQFQPIRQSFEIVDGKIIVPRTQIQSSALHLFVEGEMKPGEYYDLWISIPWNNIFKSRDGLELPEKISFEKSGAKFYLQITQDKESEKEREQKLRKKFRLGNSKLEKSKEN